MADLGSFFNVVLEWFAEDWAQSNSLTRFLVFPISISAFSALFGSYMGIWVSSSQKYREDQLEELKLMYLAANQAATLCNAAIGWKRQNIKDMVEKYEIDRSAIIRELATPTVNKRRIKYRMDLQYLPYAIPKEGRLESTLLRMRTVSAQDMLQLEAILAVTEQLRELVDKRNSWISEFKEQYPQFGENNKMQAYFGFPDVSGSVDSNYRDIITALSDLTGDLIFHTYHLYTRLLRASYKQKREMRWSDRKKIKIMRMDFSNSQAQGLFPELSQYRQWWSEAKVEKKKLFRLQKTHDERLSRPFWEL